MGHGCFGLGPSRLFEQVEYPQRVEVPQPRAPYGVKGVGEIGLVPTAGAVAGAFYEDEAGTGS